jgi:hypothetical protein
MKKNIFSAFLILLTCLSISAFAQKQEQPLKTSAQKMSRHEIKVLIDSLGNALNRWYIYPDKRLQC